MVLISIFVERNVGLFWMHVCEQKIERHISRLIYETFVALCISFQVDDWRGNVIFPNSIVYIFIKRKRIALIKDEL